MQSGAKADTQLHMPSRELKVSRLETFVIKLFTSLQLGDHLYNSILRIR
jgi:hypothetical protein